MTLRAARGARGMPGAGAAVAMAVGRLWGTRAITVGSGVREAGGAGLVGWEMGAVGGCGWWGQDLGTVDGAGGSGDSWWGRWWQGWWHGAVAEQHRACGYCVPPWCDR